MGANVVISKIEKGLIDSVIGKYPELQIKNGRLLEYVARPARTSNFSSKKKLKWDAFEAKLRQIFYTDKGTFWGPVLASVNPPEFDNGDVNERLHTTRLIDFSASFQILNVVTADLENQELVSPLNMIYPITVEAGETIQFQFRMPYFLKGRR